MASDQQHEGADGDVVGLTLHDRLSALLRPLALEVCMNPGMRIADDAGERVADHAPIDDARPTRVQVPKMVSRSCVIMTTVSCSSRCRYMHQLVEGRGADRIEPGGRLVEEQQLRIERQRARQRRALDHAAGQLGRDTCGRRRAGSPTRLSLSIASSSSVARVAAAGARASAAARSAAPSAR